MKYICVFCGSSPGNNPAYVRVAQALGHMLVEQGLGLVYGGGKVGLMGKIAQAVVQKGGEVIGVIPEGLFEKEVAFTQHIDLRIVDSMHTRKALMSSLSDGFIALPGGLGTMEELFEMLTWAQLGIHQKPCGLLNVNGYYTPLIHFLNHMTQEGFVQPIHRDILQVDTDPDRLLQKLVDYEPIHLDKAEWALNLSES